MANAPLPQPRPLLRRLLENGTLIGLSDAELVDRYAATRDQETFAFLVTRHAPMVMAVCRGLLGTTADAEDAFQATFLVLLRRIGTFPVGPSLSGWLYRVARRVSRQAHRSEARRRRRELAFQPREAERECEFERSELLSLIRDEIELLPERYRAPIVLCDLGGMSREEAAALLRCPAGTVGGRLARARQRLRDRLVRRGLAPSLTALAATLAADTASAVPADLIHRTIGTATRLEAGRASLVGAISAEVAALMEGVKYPMLHAHWKSATAALLTVAVTSAWAFVRHAPIQPPSPPAHTTQALASKAPEAAKQPDATQVREPNVERFQLANGLKVIFQPIAEADQVALVVLYSVGENHDPAGRSGLGHMVEHLYLTAAAGDEKARTVEGVASRYPTGSNGQTGDRYTVLATTFPAKNLEAELKDAADRMSDLKITAADLDRERSRLLEEVANIFERSPALAALNHARELARPAPAGGRGGGLPEHVRAITVEEVTTHWRRYYKPRNAIIALAGAIDPKMASRAIKDHFAELPTGEAPPTPRKFGPLKPGATRELAIATFRSANEPIACLAYLAPRPGSELYAPFLVLISRLWAGMDKLGAGPAFPFPVYFTPLDDGTIVAVSAPAPHGETATQAFTRLEAFVAQTLGPELADRDLTAARAQLGPFLGLANVPTSMLARNPYGVAFSLGRREQLGLNSTQLDRELESVTDRDLRRAIDMVFSPKRHTAAFISPTK
ncbi:sigma-70 family RNA polymerase sigma factor [Singulisphaera acidiphila]|uniref:RNA polymerase sigma factor, sigma-70 family n=1 Tax=Singulisphaera acidiphila (strain ATCC BAA-1392 / DSM 18658 / VKM B-2454 / MOB10) TaxID=886293 RepID=L0DKF5_SINAD|nr:sigma-70 family RNA polymerase sigma factor [Singulisphaera acidiphila]AGA29141.1 RNA polymerase sigma factor, sigma-70 family [Singulisphaera acidiphila DSM 18658]